MADPRRALRLLAEVIADAIWREDVEQAHASSPPAATDDGCLQRTGTDGGSNDDTER